MNILEELQRLQVSVNGNNKPNRIHIHPAHVETLQALPALIRVARAAEAYRRAIKEDDDSMNAYYILMREQGDLDEALQQLRNLGEAND